MDCLIAAGFISLGAFIGLLVGWAVNAEKEPSAKGYSAIIAAGAGAVASFVPFFSPLTAREMWLYPMALLAGLLLAPLFDVAYTWFYSRPLIADVFHTYDKQYEDNTRPKNRSRSKRGG
jgi:hypothetical protein